MPHAELKVFIIQGLWFLRLLTPGQRDNELSKFIYLAIDRQVATVLLVDDVIA